MALTGEALRRYETERCLASLQRAVECLHEARWIVSKYRIELEPIGGLLVDAVESWQDEVKACLQPQ